MNFQDFFTPQLRAMLTEPTAPINEVLSLPYVARSARIGFPQLIDYFALHSREMLKFAFSQPSPGENGNISYNAYAILLMGDPKILTPVLQDFSFRDVATELLSDKNANPVMIGRLASITLNCLSNVNELAVESCGFIYKFLPHCGNPSVFNFFITICGDDPRVSPTQMWLNEMGFSEFVFREFNNIDVNYDPKDSKNIWKDPVFVRILCLYQLVTRCCTNQILRNHFRTPDIVAVLQKDVIHAPDYLKSARWSAINAATCKETAVPLLKMIPNALQLLTEQFTSLKSYRVSALNFITNMMTLAPLTFDLLLQSSMPQMLVNLVLTFPNSTILHNSFLRFVQNGLLNEQFALTIASVYTPIIIDCAIEGTNRILLPCCMEMMKLFNNAARDDRNIAQALHETTGYDDFVKKNLKEYMRILDKPYGEDSATALFHKMKNFFG
ncbi:hypothetical protein M9Y10_041780 [Tritrichomonas musculus]|uniref:Uncharacterized protein n=1 Tax=Tritrichomonas musculus TaxID=1915356 RepID=A0ABR2K617_9EUKA